MNIVNFVGTSFKYPLVVTTRSNLEKVSGNDNLKQSISSIITTPIGSVFFNENYGSMVSRLVFEPNDKILESLLDFHIRDAVEKWEKRVKIVGITFENVNEIQKDCKIFFENRITNEVDYLVYPFLKEISN